MDGVSERTLRHTQWKVWLVYIFFSRKCEKVTSIFSLQLGNLRTLVNQGNLLRGFYSLLIVVQLDSLTKLEP